MTKNKDMSWVKHLPPAEYAQMQRDLLAASTREEVAQLVHEWKATALVWADPELVRALTTPIDDMDLGPVPRPEPGDHPSFG